MSFDPTFGKTGFALRLMELRFRKLRLSQKVFAARFAIPIGTVRDVEQMRTRPSATLRVLIAAIELDANLIARAARRTDNQ